VSPNNTPSTIIFYDGTCAFCHWTVKFVINDRSENSKNILFAPRGGDTFNKFFTKEERDLLPASIILRLSDGSIFVKSTAVALILAQLDAPWRIVSKVILIIPRPLRDFGYTLVASIRHRIMGKAEQLCPVVPEEMRARILL
jgi:predicted DCC family thiol-disulfide oxidoreductase YuxK